MITDGAPVTATETKKHRTSNTPATDLDLKDLSLNVKDKWILNPDFTLRWTTPAEFANTASLFEVSLDDRLTTGSGRVALTSTLKALDTSINKAQAFVKIYLKDKFDNDSYTAYLPQFGITQKGNKWVFPVDRNKRLAAMQLTIKAVAAHGFEDKKYGLAFWQDIFIRYEAALKLSVNTDSNVAKLVRTKNQHRLQIQKTLNALIHIIKANYPNTWAAELREWGFQKEKY
jgi:hypothetical protein